MKRWKQSAVGGERQLNSSSLRALPKHFAQLDYGQRLHNNTLTTWAPKMFQMAIADTEIRSHRLEHSACHACSCFSTGLISPGQGLVPQGHFREWYCSPGFVHWPAQQGSTSSICGNFNYFFQIVLHIWNCSFQNIETRFFPCETRHTVIKDSISVANSTRLMMCCFSNTQISTKKKERRQGKRIKCKGIL